MADAKARWTSPSDYTDALDFPDRGIEGESAEGTAAWNELRAALEASRNAVGALERQLAETKHASRGRRRHSADRH